MDIPSKTHFRVLFDFAITGTYNRQGLPCLLRSSSTPSMAFPIVVADVACIHPVFEKFSPIMNSVIFSHSHAEQKPHISPDPLSTIPVYSYEVRKEDRRRSCYNVAPHSGKRELGTATSRGGIGTFKWVQNVFRPNGFVPGYTAREGHWMVWP